MEDASSADGEPQGDLFSGDWRACVLSGEIRSTSALCDIISFLAHAGWWGELVVEEGATTRSLYFDESHVVAAQSSAENERLGAVLCRCEALTQEQADAAAERAKEKNVRFGEAVVLLGYMTREKLFSLMRKQVEAIFAGIAAVDHGKFLFFEGFDDADLSYRNKQSVDALLLDAISKMEAARHLGTADARASGAQHAEPSTSEGPPPASEDPFAAFDTQTPVEPRIESTPSVPPLNPSRAKPVTSIGIAELEVTRALFQQVHTGQASMKPQVRPALSVKRTIEVYNDAIAVLLRELDAMDEGDAVREALAKFASSEAEDGTLAPVTPADDGTIDVLDTIAKIARASDPERAEERLGTWLYDYASYAVFLARPHLERRDEARSGPSGRVSRRVAQMLDPIAPAGELTMTPPELPPFPAIPTLQDPPRTTMPVSALRAEVPDLVVPTRVRAPGSSTLRLRKAASAALVPGVDPSRTARMGSASLDDLEARRTKKLHALGARAAPRASMAPVSAAAVSGGDHTSAPAIARSPSPALSPSPLARVTPAAGPRRGHPAVRMANVSPSTDEGTAAGALPPAVRGSGVRASVVAFVAVACIVLGMLAGGRAGIFSDGSTARALKSGDVAPSIAKNGGGGEIVVACEPECGMVYVDGKRITALHDPIPIGNGPHEVVVARPGYAQQLKRITVTDGQSLAVGFQLARPAH